MRSYLEQYSKQNPTIFHMPGHKGYGIFDKYGYGDFFRDFVSWDITEIPGADNLHNPEGIIKNAMENYQNLYDSKASYLLINGTSSGIIASMLATMEAGDKVLAARNCHKSVHSAMSLGRIEAEYVYPTLLPQGILGPVTAESVEEALDNDKAGQIKAVILPSPNYYGICSDIEAIAKVCHERDRVLIVDQAHGAHLKFFSKFLGKNSSLPKSAEEQGADIVINSIHKTLASFTQSAVLNVMTDRVDRYLLEEKLAQVQSTSPSYVLMAGLFVNSEILLNHGEEVIGQWQENIDYFYEEAKKIPGLSVIEDENLDSTKLNLDMSLLGMDGCRLEKALMDEAIYTEFYTGNILMCMTGIGNTMDDMKKLLKVLTKISSERELAEEKTSWSGFIIPKQGKVGKVSGEKEFVDLKDSAGRTSVRMITPYPPGIPFVCPKEEITEEAVGLLEEIVKQEKEVFGIDDNKVLVYK